MRCSPTASTCRSADDRSTASARSRADAVNPLEGGFHPHPFFVLLLRRHEAQGRRSGCIVSETAERIGRPRSDRARRSRSRCGSGLEEAGDAVGWPLNRVTGAFDDPIDLGQLRRATVSEQPFQIGVKPAHPRRSSHGRRSRAIDSRPHGSALAARRARPRPARMRTGARTVRRTRQLPRGRRLEAGSALDARDLRHRPAAHFAAEFEQGGAGCGQARLRSGTTAVAEPLFGLEEVDARREKL